MKPTPESLRRTADAIESYRIDSNTPIEMRCLNGGNWGRVEFPNFNSIANYEYRRAPEPVTRPWSKPEDVPGPVCWLMLDTTLQDDFLTQVLTVGDCGVRAVFEDGRVAFLTWERLALLNPRNSTDRKTFSPCAVTEEAK